MKKPTPAKTPTGETVIERNRKRKEWTQGQLAQFIGVTYSAVSRWERRDRKYRPSPPVARDIALIFGIEADTILLDYGPIKKRHVHRHNAEAAS